MAHSSGKGRVVRPGLICLACLAAALLLSAPMAYGGEFAADAEASTTVTGTMEGKGPVFTIEGLELTCKKDSMSGTMAESSETLSEHPTFSECTGFGFVSATVTTAGCNLVFHAGEGTEVEEEFSGTADVSCEKEKKISLVAGSCEVQIGSQSGVNSVKYVDGPETLREHFVLTASLSSLKYTKTKDGFLCPLSGTGEATGGTFSETALMTGVSEAEAVRVMLRNKTQLCRANEVNCLAANRYFGGIKGTLVGAPAVLTVKNAVNVEKGKISCAASTFEGSFKGNGMPEAGGVTSFVFESPLNVGKKCDYQPNGGALQVGVVTIAMQNLAYAASELEYHPGGGRTGWLRFQKKGIVSATMNVTIGAVGPCTYFVNTFKGPVTNGAPTKFASANVEWKLLEPEFAPPGCAELAKVLWSLEWSLTTTKPGEVGALFLANT